jgi:hypothetical protein
MQIGADWWELVSEKGVSRGWFSACLPEYNKGGIGVLRVSIEVLIGGGTDPSGLESPHGPPGGRSRAG